MAAIEAVFKYPFSIEDEPFEIQLPQGAKIVAVFVQDTRPCLWAQVDPKAEKEPVRFLVCGTGHPIGKPVEGADHWEHIATFPMAGGKLIWHLFMERQS